MGGLWAQGITLTKDGSWIVFGQRQNNFFKRWLFDLCEYSLDKYSVKKVDQNSTLYDESISLPFECKKILQDLECKFYALDRYGYLYKLLKDESRYVAQKITIQWPDEFFEMRFLDFVINENTIAVLTTAGRVIEFSATDLTSFKMSASVFLQPQNFHLFFEQSIVKMLDSKDMEICNGRGKHAEFGSFISQSRPIFNLNQKYWLKVLHNWKRIGCFITAALLIKYIPFRKFLSFKIGAAIVGSSLFAIIFILNYLNHNLKVWPI